VALSGINANTNSTQARLLREIDAVTKFRSKDHTNKLCNA
jgi:hypothetical protein